MIGAVAGGVLGSLIPFELEGIDFCMPALFVIIFIDQWEKAKDHFPALIVYCLKDVRTDFGGKGICQLIAVAVVALSYKWKHNTFISIIAGTACYMLLLSM